ncbi:MAG TPA: copper chaperone PCu(A)C [Burkholderiaceae bacterium]|nr:copper chaperone PCu(A)C [Burkholderiaceae bacterium]
MIKTLLRACALVPMVVAVAAFAHEFHAGSIRIGHPWAPMTASGQVNGGAYMKLQNNGTTPDRLVGAVTPAADHVEMHSMKLEGDVMRMREIEAIEVPPGGLVELKPGGLHLMLVGLKAPLKQDEKVQLTLRFEKAGDVKVDMKIDRPQPSGAADHKH